MPIQPGLALQVKGLELPDPLAMQAQATQIQNALQQQRMGEMQIQNALREQQRTQELERLMAGFSPEAPASEVAGRLQQRGFFKQAGETLQQAALREKTAQEAQAARFTEVKTKAELAGRLFAGVTDQDSYTAARTRVIQQNLAQPNEIPETYDKAAVDRILSNAVDVSTRMGLELKERQTAAQEATAKAAGVRGEAAMISARAAEARAGIERKPELQRLQELRDTLPPGSMQRIEVENRIDALGRPAAPTLTDVVDPDDPTRMLKVDARVYTGGGFTAPGVVGIAGKEPSAGKRAAEQSAAREQFLDILDTLQASFDELNRMRAIPSEQRGALSNLISKAEASDIGQVAGRAVGAEAQTVRDRITASRMALMSALKKLTGKSASELNSNVELRLNLDALSNPGETYQAATQKIDDLRRFYAQEPAPTPSPGGRPGVTDRRSSTPRGVAPGESKGVVDFGSLK